MYDSAYIHGREHTQSDICLYMCVYAHSVCGMPGQHLTLPWLTLGYI